MTVLLTYFAVLFYLLCGHALADYVFQTDTMAKAKNFNTPMPGVPWPYWLTAHALTHGLVVAVIVAVYASDKAHNWHLATILGVVEAGLHWLIDEAKCAGQTNIHQDQLLHIACKAVWAAVAVIVV